MDTTQISYWLKRYFRYRLRVGKTKMVIDCLTTVKYGMIFLAYF
ncbi:hypothetical protein AO374_1693 [Moraxella catarrhalis]|nr:hypothetical protein EJK50_1619 [Moraxella catarrhalis]OAV16206.1 hypothetical protein AO374_1693 [Moraxella catarrhalis]